MLIGKYSFKKSNQWSQLQKADIVLSEYLEDRTRKKVARGYAPTRVIWIIA
jgi:hypothetical protein